MRRIVQASLFAGAVSVLAAIAMRGSDPAFAVSPKVQAAIKSLEKIEADGAKFQAFCKLLRDMENVPERDVAKAEALDVQLEALLGSIGCRLGTSAVTSIRSPRTDKPSRRPLRRSRRSAPNDGVPRLQILGVRPLS